MKFWLPQGPMLTKTKNIRKKSKKFFFSQNEKTLLDIWPRGSHNSNLKEIHAITSEIIDATDERRVTDDGRRTNFDFMSSDDSQAELKNCPPGCILRNQYLLFDL